MSLTEQIVHISRKLPIASTGGSVPMSPTWLGALGTTFGEKPDCGTVVFPARALPVGIHSVWPTKIRLASEMLLTDCSAAMLTLKCSEILNRSSPACTVYVLAH